MHAECTRNICIFPRELPYAVWGHGTRYAGDGFMGPTRFLDLYSTDYDGLLDKGNGGGVSSQRCGTGNINDSHEIRTGLTIEIGA
ncbi:hypothetical protein ACLOJK_007228 [Asimina triloba]